VAGTPPPAEAKLPTVKNCGAGREIDPGQVIREWHNVGTTLHLQLLFRMVSAHAMDLCRLFDGQQCLRSELGRGCEANSNLASSWIQLNAVECPRLQSEPQSERRQINAHASRVEGRDFNQVAFPGDVSSESLRTKLRVLHDGGCRIPRMAEKIWAVVAGDGIGF